VDTETHSSPRYAVAAARSMRGRSMPPTPNYYSKSEVLVALARASPNNLRYYVPPASSAHSRQTRARQRVYVKPRYRYTVPVRGAWYLERERDMSPDIEVEEQRRAPLSLLAYLRSLQVALVRNRIRPRKSYVTVRPAFKKVIDHINIKSLVTSPM